MLTEDFEQAQNLSSQVEQARQRAVLAASDAGSARDDAWNALHAVREHANATSQVVDGAERARDEAQAAADRAEAPTDSMVAELAGNPVSLTRVAVDQATGDMITTEGSTTQAAGDARWLKRDGADIAVASEIERTGSEIQVSGDARWVTRSAAGTLIASEIESAGSDTQTAGDARWVTQTGADILVASEIERTGSETQVSGDNRWVTNEGADTTVSALLASDGSETQAAGDGRWLTNVGTDAAVGGLLSQEGSEAQVAADARYMRTIMQPTAPPVTLGAMWIDSTTGKMHYPVDLGPSPRINKATNPSFESTTSMATAPVPAQFVAASQNLRYSSLDSGVAGQNWADRKAALAQVITDSGAAIVGCQENDNANTLTSQTQQLKALLGGTWAVADGSANNGILFKSDVFERLSAPTTLDVNRVNLQSGTQRTMTYAFFRHIATGRRIIFAVTHFIVDASSTANNPARTESAHLVGRLLSELRAKENDRPAIILTGDFNQSTNITDSPYAVLAGYGLSNVKATATTVENPTLNSYNGFDPAMAGRQNGECVDGVLTTSDLSIPSAGVFVKYATGSALPLATPIPSDHNMVRANVSLVQLPAVRFQGTSASVTMGGSATAYQSTKWSEKGAVSACIDPAGAPTGSATAMYPAGQAGAMDRLGLEAGKTYTFAATYHLDTEQTGTPDGNARRIIIGVTNSAGSTSFSVAGSNTPPNAAGTTRCIVTYTIPAGSQNCFVRLMHGALNTPGYWDSLLVEEGSTSGAYFDGDTPGCYWEGTPHASRSIYPGPSWVPVN